MHIKINSKNVGLTSINAVYLLIIVVFVVYLGIDLQYNTAFVDEAIYATIGEEVLRGIYWENAISWMGGSYLYPLISAVLNREFGLEGIRFFAIICMVIGGLSIARIARQLGGKFTEVVALGMFLFTANTLNLAQLGTYDGPSMAFLSTGTLLATLSRYKTGKKKFAYIILSGILVAFAIIAKYIAVLFTPALVLLVFYKNKRVYILETLVWSALVYSIVGYYVYFNLTDLLVFFTGGNFSEIASRLAIAKEVATYLYVLIIATPFALVYAFKKLSHEKKTLVVIFFLAGTMPLLYHFGTSNIRSSWKHLVFTGFFWTPLSAWFLARLYKILKRHHAEKNILNNIAQLSSTLLFILIVASLWINLGQHWRFQRSWPSATKSIEYLQENLKPDEKVFAEASAVYKYHLFTGFEDPSSWASTWWLEYEGNQGIDAMKEALRDQHFDYVILNGYFTSYINQEIIWDVSQNYVPVVEDKYVVFGKYDHVTVVWKAKRKV